MFCIPDNFFDFSSQQTCSSEQKTNSASMDKTGNRRSRKAPPEGKVPVKNEVIKCQEAEKCLSKRTWQNIRDYWKNRINWHKRP